MKLSILTLAFLLSLARSQIITSNNLFDFSADFSNTGSFTLPIDNDPGCTLLGSSSQPYVAFNWTFATTGVRRLVLTGDDYVIVYPNYFDPSAPCTNAVFLYENTDNGDLGVEFSTSQIFQAGFYTFVISSDEENQVTGALIEGGYQGEVLFTSPQYYPPYQEDDDEDIECYLEEDLLQYGSTTFTAGVTGYYDFAVFFAPNVTEDYDDYEYVTYIAIYAGNPNATLDVDACSSGGDTGSSLIQAQQSEDDESYYAEAVYVSLTAGSVYTVVYSTDSVTIVGGAFSLIVTPTRRVAIGSSFTFDAPTLDSYGDSVCTPDPDNINQQYVAVSFPVLPNTFIAIYSEAIDNIEDEDDDFTFFVYTGINVGTSLTSPSACPIDGSYIDYEYYLENIYPTGSDTYFSVVVTPDNEDDDEGVETGEQIDFQVLGGTQIYSFGYVLDVSTTATVATSATVATVAATATVASTATVATSAVATTATTATVATTATTATTAAAATTATVATTATTAATTATVATTATTASTATTAAAAATSATSTSHPTTTTTSHVTTGNTTRNETTTSTTGSPLVPTTTTTASASHVFVSGIVAVLAVVALLF